MDQGSTMKRSAVHNFAPTVTKFCVMWEGQALPHDTKFGNSRCEIVGRRVIFIWSLIHWLRWSGLIKAEPEHHHRHRRLRLCQTYVAHCRGGTDQVSLTWSTMSIKGWHHLLVFPFHSYLFHWSPTNCSSQFNTSLTPEVGTSLQGTKDIIAFLVDPTGITEYEYEYEIFIAQISQRYLEVWASS